MKQTIGDVAKEAGVSIATVSRVINGNYPVKESTRQKVQKVIDEMQFEPNVLARGLINRKSDTIGVIVPSITNLFFPSVVKAIEKTLRSEGYHIYLCDTDADPAKELSYMRSLASRQVDGIIIIDPTIDNMKNGYFEEMNKKLPLVSINGYSNNIDCNFVLNDEEMGTTQAMHYLFSLGHQNIAFMRGKNSYSYDIKEKIYTQMMEEHNLQANINIINIGEGNTEHTVNEAMTKAEQFFMQESNTTAIFTCNDIMALGAINACRRIGKLIPDEVSVIGFDNIELSVLIEPKLTTVDQNMHELGTVAAKMLLDILEEKTRIKTDIVTHPETRKVVVTSTLIERDSCQKVSP
ncbi:MAG TPA: LacI family transcriptional regulator [Epulopiscium sp.]|nr:LacI family transcriptional regulator [Candidatus Epulonipiscium sp.]